MSLGGRPVVRPERGAGHARVHVGDREAVAAADQEQVQELQHGVRLVAQVRGAARAPGAGAAKPPARPPPTGPSATATGSDARSPSTCAWRLFSLNASSAAPPSPPSPPSVFGNVVIPPNPSRLSTFS